MITENDAREKVINFLLTFPGFKAEADSGNPPVIKSEKTEKHKFGWLFYYNGKLSIEGDKTKSYFGANPCFVDKYDGSIHIVRYFEKEEFFENYEKNKK
jgi:hypothetical protein